MLDDFHPLVLTLQAFPGRVYVVVGGIFHRVVPMSTPGSSNVAVTGKWGPGVSRCISVIKNGDVIPASHVIVYQRVLLMPK